MTGRIPAALPLLTEEEKEAVKKVLDSGQITSGPKVKEFEQLFAEFVGVKEAVAVSSGTAAIHTALMSLGIGPGDKVIVTPYSFIASVSPVLFVGATPVFADIDMESFNITPETIMQVLDDDFTAVLPVHLYGQMADMDGIMEVARDNDLLVIEDACQAHGAEFKGKQAGSIGDVGCFSFYATKNMVTGEGGIITTDDSSIAKRARSLREHGAVKKNRYDTIGYNFLMTDIEAAIGIVQLNKLDEMNERRRDNASTLNEDLEFLEEKGLVKLPREIKQRKHVYNQYALRILSEKKKKVVDGMQKAGIGVRHGYDLPIYSQKAVDMAAHCPNAEIACEQVIWVPVHPILGNIPMHRISWGLKQFLL